MPGGAGPGAFGSAGRIGAIASEGFSATAIADAVGAGEPFDDDLVARTTINATQALTTTRASCQSQLLVRSRDGSAFDPAVALCIDVRHSVWNQHYDIRNAGDYRNSHGSRLQGSDVGEIAAPGAWPTVGELISSAELAPAFYSDQSGSKLPHSKRALALTRQTRASKTATRSMSSSPCRARPPCPSVYESGCGRWDGAGWENERAPSG
jgi:hypothetical protein